MPVDITYSLVHLDADLYISTRDAIIYFYPRLNPGAVCIFDDYKWPKCEGVQKAIEELIPNEELFVLEGECQAWFVKK